MKIAFTFMAMLIVALAAQSQRPVASLGLEKSVTGMEYGAMALYRTKAQWGFGGFYQTELPKKSEGLKGANTFYGAVLYAPVMKSQKINFYMNIRLGVVNKTFVIITPGLETELIFSKRVSLGLGMGFRKSYPALAARIYTRIL